MSRPDSLAIRHSWAKVQVHTPLELLSEAEPAAGLVPSAYIEPAPPLYRAVALYDYEPNGEGEVLMKENEKLSVYLKEDEWILVKIDRKGTVSKPAIGYVPANYVEEGEGDGEVRRSNTSHSVVLTASLRPRKKRLSLLLPFPFHQR